MTKEHNSEKLLQKILEDSLLISKILRVSIRDTKPHVFGETNTQFQKKYMFGRNIGIPYCRSSIH